MGASRIKGIVIEIGGETTKLDKALAGTNKEIKNTQQALKDVERLLKLDPKNTELLRQKQELLSRSVELTREKLDEMRAAAETADEALARGTKFEEKMKRYTEAAQWASDKLAKLYQEQDALGKKIQDGLISWDDATPRRAELWEKIEKTEQYLEKANKKIKETTETLKGAKISTDQYDALQRELAETEQEYEAAEKAAKDFNSSVSGISKAAETFSTGAGRVANATKGISTAAAGVLGTMAAMVPATEDYRVSLSMLENNAREVGVGMDVVRASFEQCVVATDRVDNSVEALSNLLQAGFTESNLQKAVEGLTGAYLRFPDTLKIESLADSLQETLAQGEATGQFAELLKRCGINVETFNDELSRCPGLANKQNYVLNQLAHQGLMDTYKGWVENNEAMVESRMATLNMKDATAELAEKIEPITTKLVNMASEIVGWFASLDEDAQTTILGVLAAVAMISPVASTVSNVTNAVSGLTKMFESLNLKTVAVVAAIGLFALLGAEIAKNWDNMSTLQKVVAVLGLVAAAALAAAIAMGAFQSAFTMGLAAVGIVAGVTAVVVAIKSAQKDAEKMQSSVSGNVPHFRNGGVAGQNRPFMAVVGDNPNEPEVIAPYSMIRDAAAEAIAKNGGGGGSQTFVFRFEGSLAQLGRVLEPHIETAKANRGGSMRGS